VNEGQGFDRKSLRTVIGKNADLADLAQDCVCFANLVGRRTVVSDREQRLVASASLARRKLRCSRGFSRPSIGQVSDRPCGLSDRRTVAP